ncbi:MAG: hypothetical protein MJ223_01225 [Mycoplasmoidaceae bacterium]|nr:hypothetical protein [Mycoplasmoidaceae bacterium]
MTYLTTSFLTENNLQLMNKYGYKLAKVEYDGVQTSVLYADGKLNLDVIATDGGYN